MSPRRTTIALSLALLALAGCETAQPPAPPNTLVAAKVSAAPNMAALAADPVWAAAQPLSFRIGDGVNFAGGKGETQVTLKAAYTADTLYMLVQYADPTNSIRRSP